MPTPPANPTALPPTAAATPAPTPATPPAKLLELEYERFVEFGQVLDRAGRRYLVAYLRHRLEPDRPLPPELDDAYFRYFRGALERVLGLDELAELCRRNAGMRRQVATDTLKWLRQTYQEIRAKHPHEDEVTRLGAWSVTPLPRLRDRWPLLTTYLEGVYADDELPTGFFKKRFAELTGEAGPSAWEPLIRDLLAQWDALLNAKILEHQLHHLGERAQQFRDLVAAKVSEYTKLVKIVSPFSDYLAGYWDMSRSRP